LIVAGIADPGAGSDALDVVAGIADPGPLRRVGSAGVTYPGYNPARKVLQRLAMIVTFASLSEPWT
jgi:hypothetical protein